MDLAGQLLAQRHKAHRRMFVECVRRRQALADALHLGSGRPQSRCRIETGDDIDGPSVGLAPCSTAIELVGAPQIVFLRHESEPGRHDADDFSRIVVQLDRASEDARVAAKTALPELMAEDGNPRCVWPVVVGRYGPAQKWRHAQQREEFRGDELHLQARRLAVAGQRPRTRRPCRQRLQRAAVALPIQPVGRRDGVAPPSARRLSAAEAP